MIVSRTPFRISFFGGGTDYPAWYRENGGAVIATTIDKYCYISCRYLPPFFDYKHRVVYSRVELVKSSKEIRHPAVKAVLENLKVREGLEIHHDGDLPARSGMGSSSAFTTGLIHAVKALRHERISKADLAGLAAHLEQDVMKEWVGSQDQIMTSFGGFNCVRFNTDGTFRLTPVIMSEERSNRFQNHLMLFFTGTPRIASDVAKAQVKNIGKHRSELRTMQGMVAEAAGILQNPKSPLENFGRLLHDAWLIKRRLSHRVSTRGIDAIYEAARRAGALGGKVLGAGGGGFMLFFVRPRQQKKVAQELKRLVRVRFGLDHTGSRIVVYEPNGFGP